MRQNFRSPRRKPGRDRFDWPEAFFNQDEMAGHLEQSSSSGSSATCPAGIVGPPEIELGYDFNDCQAATHPNHVTSSLELAFKENTGSIRSGTAP
jgi:hypothetical protein